MKRKVLWASGAVLMGAAGTYLLFVRLPQPAGDGSVHTGPTLEKIQELTVLVTHRVSISDIVETQIVGHTGGIRAIVMVQGDVIMGVDLQQARVVSRDETRRHLILELPPPRASSPRVDHGRTRIYALDAWGLWCLVPGSAAQAAVADRAFRDAQGAVEKAGNDPGLIVQAQERTQRIVERFGRDLGWEIHVRWPE